MTKGLLVMRRLKKANNVMCPVEFKKENEANGFLVRCEADVGGAGA